VMKSSHNAALQEAPKGFDIIGVDLTTHIDAFAMLDDLVGIEQIQATVSGVLISSEQADIGRNRLTDEAVQRRAAGVLYHLADDVSFTADSADDGSFTGCFAPGFMAFLVPMAVLVFSADVSFVNLDNAHQLLKVGIVHRSPKPMAHVPSRPVIAAPDLALDLESADTLLAIQHLPENLEPDSQGIFGVLEDGIDCDREPIGRLTAQFADPIERFPIELADLRVTASRTLHHAIWPPMVHEELFARFVGREGRHQVFESHHD
jgi:hypothetical protein